MSIYDLRPGQTGVINNVKGDQKLAKRLSALGFVQGTKVKLQNYAPLGDPVIIQIRGFKVAIRKNDSKSIYLEEA